MYKLPALCLGHMRHSIIVIILIAILCLVPLRCLSIKHIWLFLRKILVYLHAFEKMRKSTGGGGAGIRAIFQILIACAFGKEVLSITSSFIIA